MKRLVLHIYIMFMALTAMACPSNEVKLVQDWDKTFPKSEKVNHEKVTLMDGKAEGYDFVRKPNPVPANKQLLIVPGASHCDLYDGGGKGMIPWDNIEDFLKKNLK